MEGCVFCAIIEGKAPGLRVAEDDLCVAFLDVKPLFVGHTLVVPRVHRAVLRDVPSPELTALMTLGQRVSRALEDGLGAQGTFLAMNDRVSQSVPHVHLHVVPRKKGDGLRGFFWPRHKYSGDEAETTAAKLRAVLR
ncbi:MAG TPA: HIT family protein [Polyangiaceae bacterium]|jgi:histidine triad (HIT) family protein|nr:HIT family protein [Polyangiaceae bacterium]